MKLGITRVRNEIDVLPTTIDRLKDHLDGVIVYDDASNDGTWDYIMDEPFIIDCTFNYRWQSEPEERKKAETWHRQELYKYSLYWNPEWLLYFDADEHIYFDDIDWESNNDYFFRLYDVYITPNDVDKYFMDREMIGPEYRDITMLFRPPARFYNRIPRTGRNAVYGGDVKHFGKGISVGHWEETCDYYINHLNEVLATGETISERWTKRKGKAIHTVSDYENELIKWSDRKEKGILNRY